MQLVGMAAIAGPGKDLERGEFFLCELHDLEAGLCVIHCHHQEPRLFRSRAAEQIEARGVAEMALEAEL